MGIGIFDGNLSYKGFFPLKTYKKTFRRTEPSIKAKDKKDNFYLISEEKYNVVRKFSLDIQYE